MAVIGIDLGGTKAAGAIFTSEGEIIDKKTLLLEDRKGREVSNLVISLISSLLDISLDIGISVKKIGISVPGIVFHETNTIWAPNIPGWDDYPLGKEIGNSINNQIKLCVDNDRACSILGEIWQGSARNCKNAIFIAVGTGIGAGIFMDGKILRGNNDIAGAIGWLALDRTYMKEYDTVGCFEFNASGEGLIKVARQLIGKNNHYIGPLINPITAKDIFLAYDSGDPIATEVIHQAIRFYGMTVANLISIFNPEKIIFGGGLFGPAARFLNEIYREAEKWAQPVSFRKFSLNASELGNDAALYGAGYMALSQA